MSREGSGVGDKDGDMLGSDFNNSECMENIEEKFGDCRKIRCGKVTGYEIKMDGSEEESNLIMRTNVYANAVYNSLIDLLDELKFRTSRNNMALNIIAAMLLNHMLRTINSDAWENVFDVVVESIRQQFINIKKRDEK